MSLSAPLPGADNSLRTHQLLPLVPKVLWFSQRSHRAVRPAYGPEQGLSSEVKRVVPKVRALLAFKAAQTATLIGNFWELSMRPAGGVIGVP